MSPPLALHTTVLTPVPAPFSACLQRWPFGRGFTESQWCWRCKGSDCQTYEVGILYPTERLIQCCLAFTLAGNRLLLVSQVVVPTDSAACLGKPRSLYLAYTPRVVSFTKQAELIGVSNLARQAFLDLALYWIFQTSRKEGGHFWILSSAECLWLPEGCSPNRANWKLC